MNDPYHEVQSEIQGSLQAAETLRASYVRIRSTAHEGSEELNWARSELKATLASLEADLEDLDDSVKSVEQAGARLFGLEEREVMARRAYVNDVRRTITTMRAEVEGRPLAPLSASDARRVAPNGPGRPVNGEGEDDQAEWAREEQQMMIEQQDQTLTSIQGTLHTLAQQAGLIGREVEEHNEMLTDLESGVDRAEGKLAGAMTKMKKFIRETEETKSGWCITILIIVLCILLLVAVLI
ncbi:t-SNARE [Auriculariales sp. MPI-PUGE-AT-0066]|nr:t-SNARE [Auriculariales sp. MPI-PUGE-AT-0066]